MIKALDALWIVVGAGMVLFATGVLATGEPPGEVANQQHCAISLYQMDKLRKAIDGTMTSIEAIEGTMLLEWHTRVYFETGCDPDLFRAWYDEYWQKRQKR